MIGYFVHFGTFTLSYGNFNTSEYEKYQILKLMNFSKFIAQHFLQMTAISNWDLVKCYTDFSHGEMAIEKHENWITYYKNLIG